MILLQRGLLKMALENHLLKKGGILLMDLDKSEGWEAVCVPHLVWSAETCFGDVDLYLIR